MRNGKEPWKFPSIKLGDCCVDLHSYEDIAKKNESVTVGCLSCDGCGVQKFDENCFLRKTNN